MNEIATIDRRLLRTRQALRNALLTLLPEKGWDELTVQDICDCANIGRSTFYMHFQNKEELLSAGLSEMGEALRNRAAAQTDGASGAFAFLHGLIEHLFEQRRVFCAVVGRRSGHIVQRRFRALVLQLVSADLEKLAPAGWKREAAAHYLAGALFELLSWAVDDNHRTADEIEQYFRRLSRDVTKALLDDTPS